MKFGRALFECSSIRTFETSSSIALIIFGVTLFARSTGSTIDAARSVRGDGSRISRTLSDVIVFQLRGVPLFTSAWRFSSVIPETRSSSECFVFEPRASILKVRFVDLFRLRFMGVLWNQRHTLTVAVRCHLTFSIYVPVRRHWIILHHSWYEHE
jgi:hypothetical protein